VLEALTRDQSAAAAAHDALWATLWNRGYEDIDEPLWLPDSAYRGIVAFAWRFPEGGMLAGLDIGQAFVVFRDLAGVPPVGSRLRVLAGERDRWRIAEDAQVLGLGIELHFDGNAATDASWTGPLRTGLQRLRAALDARRVQLEARRTELGALSEPTSPEEIWRREVAAIAHQATLETEFTPEEHAVLARARAKGPRAKDEAEHRLAALRRQRFNERNGAALEAFKTERWPALRDAAAAATARYAEYRAEVLRLEEALGQVRALHERARAALPMLDAIETASFRVRSTAFDPARLGEPGYPQELVRTVELLHGAIPPRAPAAGFSAYRAPTAGPSVIPPRV
jgi:hypothetical protein